MSGSNNKNKPVKENSTKKTEKKMPKADTGFAIVGIGASAGGLETLEHFFSNMKPDSGMAFVIIQHLSPQHKSIMASILAKFTGMPVGQIENGMKVEPNCVYLNPPGMNVSFADHSFQLTAVADNNLINMPIDFFFKSLSENNGEKAVCIILSGTASDGTMGIRAIKGEGGMAMVQDPDSAKYDGMPRSAISTGLVDFVLPVEKMPGILLKYVNHIYIEKENMIITEKQAATHLQKILSLVRSATGHDFTHYKQSTIQRRIERRLAIHQLNKLSDYVLYLQKNPAEIDSLFNDMVINVTSFFRDHDAFDLLKKEVLPALLSDKESGSTIRIWSVGCSTGEEAYSLGITMAEVMESLGKHFNIQIFATDIDEKALDAARSGIYPKSIAADVSEDRLNRFFTKEGHVFKIKKQIREMCVFSIQNVISDPPFSRLDLITCRNMMIYMDNNLQKKILSLFQYSLNSGGILFLGTSESIGEYADFFQSVNSRLKLFKRKRIKGEKYLFYDDKKNYVNLKIEKNEKDIGHTLPDIQSAAEKIMLDEYAPSGVLINENNEILHFIGMTDRYLVPPTGKANFNILNMAREGLKEKLATLIHKAVRQKDEISHHDLRIKYNDDLLIVDIIVKPVKAAGTERGFLLVVFKDKTFVKFSAEKKTGLLKEKKANHAVDTLKQELQSTKEYLQANIEELETSNEELQSTNEEMQSVNEEMQSTNEELETSKEELQSTNEELVTVNSELQIKVNQLSQINDDMTNLISATEIATIFLDAKLCFKWFTPAAAKIINLRQADIGRPLDDLKTNLSNVDITLHAKNVLNDLNKVEMDILSNDRVWYSMRIMPYRTLENVIDGVVMTFVNIQKIKMAEKVNRLGVLLQNSLDAIIVVNFDGKILAWNKGSESMYGWNEGEALNMNIDKILPDDIMKEYSALLGSLKTGEIKKPFKTRRMAKSGKIINVWVIASVLIDESGNPFEIAFTERNMEWLAEA